MHRLCWCISYENEMMSATTLYYILILSDTKCYQCTYNQTGYKCNPFFFKLCAIPLELKDYMEWLMFFFFTDIDNIDLLCELKLAMKASFIYN